MNEIKVSVQNAIINIEDREKVEQQINEIAKKYSGYLPTADTLTGDKTTRANLRKVRTAIDDKRKNVKTEYNEPLIEFEDWVEKALKPLDSAIDAIDKGIKEIEENERQIRLSAIKVAFTEKAENAGLDPRIFAEKYEKYCLAANFTVHKKLKKGILDEIDVSIQREVQKQQGRKNDIASISEIALERSLTAEPYIRELDNGKGLNEILQDMLRDAKAQDEARAKREAEQAKRDAEMAQRASEFEAQRLQNSFNVPEDVTEQPKQAVNIVAEQIHQQSEPTLTEPENEQKQEVKKLKILTLEILIDPDNPLPPFKPFLDENGYRYKITNYEDVK
ncbi:hypothetical protein RR45_GL000165 [Lactococcus chungangensis CAU 28 = DSM 22330]|uniref:DUF1351 domain-containing protein n=1 Tax=Pseudolactococcus chungangensis CAU 28 = DSM 22330 TaxID=1122154 RepID=A0A1K2HBA9_9LACT|nr:DUF1351 domain-containing protein [Lactococcus chungangensis]PCS04846.1 hypothetical protein RR45_GL000165 [Lactococcus chungangensis CAU 28 = DSM 22330]SFZ73973.1 Protein of unknown function [Lactococcus chungangensis CAU 28 = DSM 22330]